ncbi:hypothetical protein SAMN04488103_1161, partial [Gemmobacter aquatilis]
MKLQLARGLLQLWCQLAQKLFLFRAAGTQNCVLFLQIAQIAKRQHLGPHREGDIRSGLFRIGLLGALGCRESRFEFDDPVGAFPELLL